MSENDKLEVRLNPRECKALLAMSGCPYRFEIKGKMGRGVGDNTLAGLVATGLAECGKSNRHSDAMGWAITEAGKRALRGQECERFQKAKPPAK